MLRIRKSFLFLSLLIFTITATTILIAETRDECCAMVGDWDHNGFIQINDLTYMTNFIYGGGSEPLCWAEGNTDYDPFNRINQKDLQVLTDNFPNGGPCGTIHTADTLTGISVYLLGINGLVSSSDTLGTVTYYFGVRNNAPQTMNIFSNSFQIYSPDGAEWNEASGNLDNDFSSYYETNISSTVTGEGSYIIEFNGYHPTSGLPLEYNDSAFSITIGPLDSSMTGKTICIDSIDLPPNGAWLWNTNSPFKAVIPQWDGPHCFTIGPCCNHDGIRGDADYNMEINVADLTSLVDYLFRGFTAPPCEDEGDVNADGSILVDDLVELVDYLFKGGPPPADC